MDGSDVAIVLQQVGREGMPEGVASSPLRETCGPDCTVDGALNRRCMKVIAPLDARVPFPKAACCGENPLPRPIGAGTGVLSPKRTRQFNMSESVLEVRIVDPLGSVELVPQRNDCRHWEHRVPLAVALWVSHDDFTPFEIKVLDAQFETFVESKSSAVEEKGNEPVGPGKSLQDRRHLASSEDRRKMLRPAGTNEFEWLQVNF